MQSYHTVKKSTSEYENVKVIVRVKQFVMEAPEVSRVPIGTAVDCTLCFYAFTATPHHTLHGSPIISVFVKFRYLQMVSVCGVQNKFPDTYGNGLYWKVSQ